MRANPVILFVVALGVGCVATSAGLPAQPVTPNSQAAAGVAAVADPACVVKSLTRAPDGLVEWSPDRQQYLTNRKDAAGTYQVYVGRGGTASPICVTCSRRPNGPAVERHKLQPRWHNSGRWLILAVERDQYTKPIINTPQLVEGWLQSGLWVNIYAVRPDGSEWHRLSDFGGSQKAEGFTGVAFTPAGDQGVWAQIVDSNIFANLFGRWELILADFQEDRNGVPAFTNLRNITPPGAKFVEPGGFAPDGKSLLLTADLGLANPQGMDQFILDVTTGRTRNLNNSPNFWDEHGVFSPDGEKIFYMSSAPYRDFPLWHNTILLRTEFMLMNKDGSGQQQITHFNVAGYPESNSLGRVSVAAGGVWAPDGRSIVAINMFFPTYETWDITFNGSCGGVVR